MKVIIQETGAVETLTLIDPAFDVETTVEFLDFHGAIGYRNYLRDFTWDDARGAYVCDKKAFERWRKIIDDQQSLEDRVYDLIGQHGSDPVYDVVMSTGDVAVEERAAAIHRALDEAFGSAESN